MKRGDRLGSWRLLERLGSGGNGEVWRARHHDGHEAALKALRKSSRERHARFLDEISFLRDRDPGPGVLPLIEVAPDGAKPLWYVMPEAVVLPRALGDEASLDERVRAVHAVAVTLARLAARGIGHRDIKPDNLFLLDGAYVVGDFGLVTYPEKDPVTRSGRRVGPTDYLAPEMREAADTADHEPADVYSLAKTAWVIFTGHSPPLPGPHRIEDDAYRLATYISDGRLHELDLLLERCTRHDPAQRPAMAEVAAELEAWLAPERPAVALSMDDVATRVRTLSEQGLRLRAAQERRAALFNEAWDAAVAGLAPVRDALSQVFPNVHDHGNPSAHAAFRDVVVLQRRETHGVYGTNADPEAVQLFLGIGVQWEAETDSAEWGAWIRLEDPYAGPRTVWAHVGSAPLGSARQRAVVSGLLTELQERLPEAAALTVARMELRVDASRYASWTGPEADAGDLRGPWGATAPFADGDAGCYVMDSGNDRVVRFGPGGRRLEWISSGGAGLEYHNLSFPAGGCFTHDRHVWVADHDNARLRYFDEQGGPLEGFGLEPPGPDVLQGPADVASGPDGSVYVVDRLREVVVVFSGVGPRNVREWGGSGRGDGQLRVPCGIAVRHGAYVYVSDSGNDRIQKFTSKGEHVRTWGSLGSAQGCFRAPHGIALDIDENVYVADSENHRVQQFTADGDFIRCWGANGGDGTPGRGPGQFVQPRGIAIDGAGNVYVAEFGTGRVQRFGPKYLEAL